MKKETDEVRILTSIIKKEKQLQISEMWCRDAALKYAKRAKKIIEVHDSKGWEKNCVN